MSKIIYDLSNIIPESTMEQLSSAINKVKNCGNDELIINEDYFVANKDIYTFLTGIHTDNGLNGNKKLIINRTMICTGKKCEIGEENAR